MWDVRKILSIPLLSPQQRHNPLDHHRVLLSKGNNGACSSQCVENVYSLQAYISDTTQPNVQFIKQAWIRMSFTVTCALFGTWYKKKINRYLRKCNRIMYCCSIRLSNESNSSCRWFVFFLSLVGKVINSLNECNSSRYAVINTVFRVFIQKSIRQLLWTRCNLR